MWRSLYFFNQVRKLTIAVGCTNMPRQACAPVAQRIEHLPCWSLNGEGI